MSLIALVTRHPWPWSIGRRWQMRASELVCVELKDAGGQHVLECEEVLALGLLAAINTVRELTRPVNVLGTQPPSPLAELLDESPAPWRAWVSIPGPPGNAEVAIVAADGSEVDLLDDMAYAEGLVHAVNLAAAIVLPEGTVQEPQS